MSTMELLPVKVFPTSVLVFATLMCSLVLFCSSVDVIEHTNTETVVKLVDDDPSQSLGSPPETSHIIHKRSTRVYLHNTFSYNLASVCSAVNSKIHIKVNDSSLNRPDDDENQYEEAWSWPLPPVFPVKVTAERKSGNKINFKFEVSHSSKVFAASVGSFDIQEKTIDFNSTKDSVHSSTSTVEFMEDSSYCNLGVPYYRNAEYIFSQASGAYVIRASVDLCRFDWRYNRDNEFYIGRDNKWQKDRWLGYMYRNVRIPKPRFQMLPDPGDKVYISKGENPTFEVEVDFYQAFDFTVRVTLWDWDNGSYVSDDVTMGGGGTVQESIDSRNQEGSQREEDERLLSIDLMGISFNNTAVRKDGAGEGRGHADVRARIRIVVNIGSRRMSGKLVLGYHWKETRWFVRPMVRSISTERTISLKLPYKLSVFPSNELEVRGGVFECDERGNRGRPRHGKNCTIECHAYGTDIRTHVIIKSPPYRPPIKSTSYFTPGAAHAVQNVGLASEEVAGLYRCMAISDNRVVKVANISLHVTGFTKITNLTVEDLGNSTSRVVCSADGDQPVTMSLSISNDDRGSRDRIDKRVGNLPYYQSSQDNNNKTTTHYILLLCSDQLQVTGLDSIVCEATGPRGRDRKKLYLPQSSDGNCNAPAPKMKPRESNLTYPVGSHGRILVFCSAVGSQDLDMMVTYGGVGKRYRIDTNVGNYFLIERDTGDGKTLSVEIQPETVKEPWATLHCGAKNKHGSDWIQFNLEDYGL